MHVCASMRAFPTLTLPAPPSLLAPFLPPGRVAWRVPTHSSPNRLISERRTAGDTPRPPPVGEVVGVSEKSAREFSSSCVQAGRGVVQV